MNEKPGLEPGFFLLEHAAGGLTGYAFLRVELYSKHDSAWIEWNPKIQADRRESSGFVYDH